MRALRILLWLATALLIGAGLGAPLLFEPSLGSLEGRLIARDSGHPVAAAITLSGPAGFHARSDAAGRFSFLRIPTGVYHLDAASRGHVVTNRAVYLQEGKTNRLDLEMVRKPSWVQLVLHHAILYPGEPTSLAVRGLTLNPSYRLRVYRVNRWARVQPHEARAYEKALAAAVAAGDVTPFSSREITPRHIDVEGVFYDRLNLEPLPVGRYLLVAYGETGSRSAESLTISRLALLVKSDNQKAVAYVADLKSGAPIQGAEVAEVAALGGALTDANGLARFSPPGGTTTYTARLGEDTVSVNSWSSSSEEPYRLFGFTDRPIYRPGDQVRFKGVLRERAGLGYRLPGRLAVAFSVTDEEGTEIYKTRLTTNDQGSFAGAFTLPKLAKAGTYTMTSRIGAFSDETFLTVASYLKPELQLSARPGKPQYVRGELATVDIQATYYFGAPVADLRLRWTLTRTPRYPSSELGDEGYEGDYEDEGGEMVSEGEGKTDAAGRLRLTLPSRLPGGERAEEENPYYDHVFNLYVYSTSEAGGSAETTASYLVTRGLFSLALQSDRYVLIPGKPTGLKVEVKDFVGHPVANQQVALSLLTESRPRERGRVVRRTLSTWTARTGKDGISQTSVTAPKEGEFIVEALARDSQGHAIAAREYLWAAGEAYWYFGEGQSELSIVSDRKQYRERDHVRLLVTSQHAGPALFCLEGDRLYEIRPLSLRRGANMIEFDLKPEYLPNVYVWVGQVYAMRLHRAEKKILISRDTRRLTVKVQPGQPEYRPGKTATCRVQVTDAQGRPAQAEVALGVVDEAIYALASDNVEDPADYFYEYRYSRVRTAFAPESYYYGGADKAPANIEVRRRFLDTAYWAPQVLTDADGRAQVAFKLPDNLTSWRVTVRAISADTRGGTGRVNFKVNKPLMVRLDLPRFATQGDRFRVSAYVHNETDRERKVALGSWARGVKLESREEQLDVPARGVIRRDWWATATADNRAVIGGSALSGALQDAVELTLPVNPLTRTQFDAWSGRTEGQVELILPIRDDSALDRSVLTLGVSPSVAASLFSSLDYLVHYPYGCVEQTVSSFLPSLHVLQLLQARGMGDSPLARRIPPMLADGLARLSSLQREEGGWGWGRWGELDIWMTSYALMALQEAKQAGYQTTGIGRALPHLENALRADNEEYPDDLAFAAYLLARLKSELAVPTIIKALSQPRSPGYPILSGRGRALCALAYFEQGNTVEAHRVMASLWATAKREGDWTYWTGLQDTQSQWWDGGANVEATAWALKAALRADSKDPRAARIAGWLLQSRRGDRWVSTRDTAIALFALVEYLRGLDEPNPNYTAVVKVNGKEVSRKTFSPDLKTWAEAAIDVPASALHRGANRVVFSRGPGAGRLYYRANLRQQVRMREDEKTAFGDVLQVRRDYFKMGRMESGGTLAYGPAARPADTFDDGERVLVRLTFNCTQRLRYVLIEDPLPAGLEPSARGDVGLMDWRSWWVDNDVRDDRVNFYLDWLPVGKRTIEYVLTARTPGRFHALPPSGFAMYQPKINGLGDPNILEVRQ